MDVRGVLVCALLVLGFVPSAMAQSESDGSNSPTYESPNPHLGLRVEPGVSIPLTSPQSDRFGVGGGQTIKAFYGLTPWLDVGPSIGFTDLPSSDNITRSGTSWDIGAGVRAKRTLGSSGLMPWADAGAAYVRTGELDRFGFDVGAGLSVPLDRAHAFRLGPFVRYRHIVQNEQTGIDGRDAKLLHAGLSFEFGSGRRPVDSAPASSTVEAKQQDCPECECEECAEPTELADRDGDGFPDDYDRCPDASGPGEQWGCPDYDGIDFNPSRIELKEKVLFDWNKADIREDSHPILDRAAKLLKKHTGFKVRVEGHADATGLDGYNQKLSEKRAQAVVDHLVEQGVDRKRFVLKGYSSSRPVDSNLTDAGRQKNRRVEFIIDLEILD